MKQIILLIFIFSVHAQASIYSQNAKVNLNLKNASVKELISEIEKQTEMGFVYDIDEIKRTGNISVNVTDCSVDNVLAKTVAPLGISYEIYEQTIILKKKKEKLPLNKDKTIAQPKNLKFSGTVKDEDGNPIPFAAIVIKGTTIGAATDENGYFEFDVEDGNYESLIVSSVGFNPQEIAINGKTEFELVLSTNISGLAEVVVTGYQVLPVERSTGSTVTVTAEDVENKGQSNLANTLEGMVAGLGIYADPSNEGSKKINIRGTSTLNGNSNPLIVIDGFITETDISQINPYDVASITVLKDAGSASIYGARAANGVIVITTKRGKKGTTNINYSNSFTFNQKPDVAYRLNRLTGSDLVDAHIDAANSAKEYNHSYQWYLDNQPQYAKYYLKATNKVYRTILMQNDGYLSQSEADAIINPLRTIDNTSQIQDLFTQSPYEEQHNLNISGGSDRNVYRSSLNYTKNKSSFIGDKTERIIWDIQNSINFSNKIKLDLSGNFRVNYHNSIPYNRNIVLDHISAYELFEDEAGNPLPTVVGSIGTANFANAGLYGGKDPIEIQRLVDLGLYDETYYPVKELDNYTQTNKGFNARVQAMLYADIAKGLKGTFGLKYEGGAYKNTRLAREESFEMKSLINNLSPRDYSGDESTLLIPKGGRITENRGDSYSYTLRAQLDYEKSIKKHNFRALTGTEVRHNNNTITITDQFGYDENSLQFRYIDKRSLSIQNISNINHPIGTLSGGLNFADKYGGYFDVTNRYFSLYGNFAYDFDQKYVLSASARIDQSNLFGTDPKYRYKPFWSVGGKWNIDKEEFFKSKLINRLVLRSSYGINGNIANDYGPFTIAQKELSYYIDSDKLTIVSPEVKDLRWERTVTMNVGTDITLLNRRIRFSMDYYVKNTDDVLALADADPTYGVSTIMKNNASLKNKGLEFSLNTINIKSEKFRWSSNFMLRKNKNRVESVTDEDTYIGYIPRRTQNIEGQPVNSFYLFNWNGLDENGNATFIDRNGEQVTIPSDHITISRYFIKEDLVYAGTSEPKITGSFSNNLSYKNFNLSFMFIFSDRHKLLKDSYGGKFISGEPNNVPADAALAWEESGDELTTDVPAFGSNDFWKSVLHDYSTKNIIDGGYIRLRELIFTYTLPEKFLKVLPVQRTSLNFRANNLFLITKNNEGIDPEAHGIGRRYFRVTPSYSFGVNINF